jgi:hypothetical protein
MDTIELGRDSASGAYRRAERSSNYPERYYTVFVRFDYGEHESQFSTEEIDVLARDDSDAWVIAGAALKEDYIEGGRIIQVIERERGWIFHDV